MSNKRFSFIGLSIEDLIKKNEKEIKFQKTKLIPSHKFGDEQALTSIFLSCMKLVKEFRNTMKILIKLQLWKR